MQNLWRKNRWSFSLIRRSLIFDKILGSQEQGPIVSGHVLISWSNTSNSACCFGDALRCVASADQNMAPHNRPLHKLFKTFWFFGMSWNSSLWNLNVYSARQKLTILRLFCHHLEYMNKSRLMLRIFEMMVSCILSVLLLIDCTVVSFSFP